MAGAHTLVARLNTSLKRSRPCDPPLTSRRAVARSLFASAARMARISEYGVKEYPESSNWLQELLGTKKPDPAAILKQQLGAEEYKVYQELLRVKEMTSAVQAI